MPILKPTLNVISLKEKGFEIIANKICDILDNIQYTEL
jgi:hypothetical protein